jgi:hypothetical protein
VARDIAEDRKIVEAATPEPWRISEKGNVCAANHSHVLRLKKNLLFAVFARTALPEYIAEVASLRADNASLRARVEKAEKALEILARRFNGLPCAVCHLRRSEYCDPDANASDNAGDGKTGREDDG